MAPHYTEADGTRQRLPALCRWEIMDRADRLKRLRFRAWHRGTKEADLLIGGFFDRFSASWEAAEIDWFEALLDIDDVLVMAWALGTEPPPPPFDGPMMQRMQQLDYVPISE